MREENRKNRPFGIVDLAKMLNVSVATVSRAFRNTHDISPETRSMILDLAKTMEFQPNKSAAALASGKTKNIGIVLPFITNYYYAKVISGIQDYAYSKGYNIILFITNDDPKKEQELVSNIATNALDGLLVSIASSSHDFTYFDKLIKKGMPIVFFDKVPHEKNVSRVMQNDIRGAYDATAFLLSNGFRNIVHLTGPKNLKMTQQRLEGYKMALSEAEIPYNESMVAYSGFSREDGEQDVERLINNQVSFNAIFAANDRKAIGAILALKARGIKVGDEVAVIGFTNDPMGEIIEPTLTSIEEPAYEIGIKSCELLIKHIRIQHFDKRDIILPNKLIVRQSVALHREA
ncbi:MAG: LacI family DNA-binding transcriptional regulator [Chitinophagaceae bacterium]